VLKSERRSLQNSQTLPKIYPSSPVFKNKVLLQNCLSFESNNDLSLNSRSERKLAEECEQNKIFASLLRKNSSHTSNPAEKLQSEENRPSDHFGENMEMTTQSGSFIPVAKSLLATSENYVFGENFQIESPDSHFLEEAFNGDFDNKKLSSGSYATHTPSEGSVYKFAKEPFDGLYSPEIQNSDLNSLSENLKALDKVERETVLEVL
jgi:hypothetical protein